LGGGVRKWAGRREGSKVMTYLRWARLNPCGLKDEQKTNDLVAFLKQFGADGKTK